MEKEIERTAQGQWNLDEITAADFLRKVADVFEVTPPSNESWLEVVFTDRWDTSQRMRLWMPAGGRHEDDTVH